MTYALGLSYKKCCLCVFVFLCFYSFLVVFYLYNAGSANLVVNVQIHGQHRYLAAVKGLNLLLLPHLPLIYDIDGRSLTTVSP